MKKRKFKNILVTGLAITATLQSIPVMGVPNTGIVRDSDGKIIKDNRPEACQAAQREADMYNLGLFYEKGHYSNPEKESYYQIRNNSYSSLPHCFRFTNSEGKPYNGMYRDDSVGLWYVLDENGFTEITGNPGKQKTFAWKDGRLYTEETRCELSPANASFDIDGNTYVCRRVILDGITAVEVYLNEWIPMYSSLQGKIWYRSNDKGICYKSQWFQDTDGKWYYFDKDCRMVRNTTIDGYHLGVDGALLG